MFQWPWWMRKNLLLNFSWRVAAETWDASCFKKGLLEKNTCAILPLKKDILSELNRCIFQISLKCIKLVIPKILFILVLCSFNFYFKIMWPPFPLNRILPPHQNKNSWPPRKDFSQTFNPPSPKLGGVHALAFIWYFIRTILSEEPCQKQGIWEKI